MAKKLSPTAAKRRDVGPARLRDIAEVAGVHASTVSRVLNPSAGGKVSDEVAARIREIASEMGYRTNAFGYGLKMQRSTTIGILIPDLTNPIFPPIIRAMDHRLRDEGYTVILGDTDSNPEQERKIVDKLMGRRAEGLILATAHLDDDLIAGVLREGTPVVLINRTTKADGVVSVTADDIVGVRLAVDHLVDLGHKTIAYVGGPRSLSTGERRRDGFVAAAKRRGLAVTDGLLRECDAYSETTGRAAMSAILDTEPDVTGVVTANDLLALGCFQAIEDRGLACPGDISVVGYNDMPFADKFNPPLTTVRVDLHQMGDRAAEALITIIRDPDTRQQPIELRPTLVVRGSTSPPRRSPRQRA